MNLRRGLLSGILFLAFFRIAAEPAGASVADILHSQGYFDGPVSRVFGKNADMIRVQINGHPFKLLIDTGAAVTMLWRDAARQAHIAEGRDLGRAGGLNGATNGNVNLAAVSSFRIAGVNLASAPVVLVDGPSADEDDSGCNGILGLVTMKVNHVFFGYDPAVFYFRPDSAGNLAGLNPFLVGQGFVPLSLTLEAVKYHFKLTLNNTTGDVVLDSGAFRTLIREDFARRAGLRESLHRITGAGLNGMRFVSPIFKPQRIAIGPLILPTLPLAAGSDRVFDTGRGGAPVGDGCVGFDLIGRLYPLLDTVDDWLYLRPVR
jgi:predicted aspartyl protease